MNAFSAASRTFSIDGERILPAGRRQLPGQGHRPEGKGEVPEGKIRSPPAIGQRRGPRVDGHVARRRRRTEPIPGASSHRLGQIGPRFVHTRERGIPIRDRSACRHIEQVVERDRALWTGERALLAVHQEGRLDRRVVLRSLEQVALDRKHILRGEGPFRRDRERKPSALRREAQGGRDKVEGAPLPNHGTPSVAGRICLVPHERGSGVRLPPSHLDGQIDRVGRSHELVRIGEVDLANPAPVGRHGDVPIRHALCAPQRTRPPAPWGPVGTRAEDLHRPDLGPVGDRELLAVDGVGTRIPVLLGKTADEAHGLASRRRALQRKRHQAASRASGERSQHPMDVGELRPPPGKARLRDAHAMLVDAADVVEVGAAHSIDVASRGGDLGDSSQPSCRRLRR